VLPRGGSLTVLDAGSATGGVSQFIQSWFLGLGIRPMVLSLDSSPLALQLSGQRGLARRVCADAARLPFSAASVDLVLCLDLLEHLSDDGVALAEFIRVLRPSGTLLINVPALPALWSRRDEKLLHCRRYTRATLAECLRGAGFEVQRVSYTNLLLLAPAGLAFLLDRIVRVKRMVGSDLITVPRPINSVLTLEQYLEAAVLRVVNFPIGVSLLAVASRPNEKPE
jgi:SAM-dependent methyltransferase